MKINKNQWEINGSLPKSRVFRPPRQRLCHSGLLPLGRRGRDQPAQLLRASSLSEEAKQHLFGLCHGKDRWHRELLYMYIYVCSYLN